MSVWDYLSKPELLGFEPVAQIKVGDDEPTFFADSGDEIDLKELDRKENSPDTEKTS